MSVGRFPTTGPSGEVLEDGGGLLAEGWSGTCLQVRGVGLSTVQNLACRIGGLTRIAVGYVGPTTRTPACFGQISIRRQGGGQLCGPIGATLPTWSLRGSAAQRSSKLFAIGWT